MSRLVGTEGGTFSVTVRMFHTRLRDLAYLYHAVLVMFDHFGYEFVLSEHARRVQGILTEVERPDLRRILRVIRAASAEMPTELPAVNVVTTDEQAVCFFVALPPLLPWEKARGVLLPGPTAESEGFFDSLFDAPETFAEDMQLTHVPKSVLTELDAPDSRGQMYHLFLSLSK